MMDSRPLVSVIICVYQGERHLRAAIDSALAQTYPSVEVVVVNDGAPARAGAPDGSAAICGDYAGRIVYRSQKNMGLAKARNRGIRESTGEYIAFLDQDDIWLPDKLQKQMRLFVQNPDLGLVYSDFSQIDDDGRKVLERTYGLRMKRRDILSDLYEDNFIGSLTAVCPRKILDEVGLFSEDLAFALDWDLWMKIACRYPADFVEEPLASWRWRANYAEDHHEITLLETYRIISRLNSELFSKLTAVQQSGAPARLARIAFSLGRVYRRRGEVSKSAQWIRTSIDHDVFTDDQMRALEEVEGRRESYSQPMF